MSIEIVIGPMFSGKTSYAISYIRRQNAIDKSCLVIKPDIDMRYTSDELIVSHNGETAKCIYWHSGKPLEVIPEMTGADCIVFEEAQFFEGFYKFIHTLLYVHKKNILIVGLDGDARQQQFGEILQCIPLATKVTKLCALCHKCKDGTLAPYTKRKEYSTEQIIIGGNDKYESVCLKHLTDVQ